MHAYNESGWSWFTLAGGGVGRMDEQEPACGRQRRDVVTGKRWSVPEVSPQIRSRLGAVCRLPSGLGKAGVSPASGLLRLAETARRRSPLAGDPAVDGSRAAVSTVLPVAKPVNLCL